MIAVVLLFAATAAADTPVQPVAPKDTVAEEPVAERKAPKEPVAERKAPKEPKEPKERKAPKKPKEPVAERKAPKEPKEPVAERKAPKEPVAERKEPVAERKAPKEPVAGEQAPTDPASKGKAAVRKAKAHSKPKPRKSAAVADPDWTNAPSFTYAHMAARACKDELKRRGVDFVEVGQARGVRAPVRIPRGVGGVLYRTALPAARRLTNPHDVFDCRLVVALDDFSAILIEHGIDDVLIFSSWRPPGRRWPTGKEAIRHPGALAIDIMRFGRKVDGKRVWVDVEKDFHGQIGAATCGPHAASPADESAKELRAIACAAADARLFTSILTPNYDRAHFNHFHFDLTIDAKWRIIR